jgi:2-oxo-4-hydroxy-4-carboxy-5-ureidoimidazoline decarboxylase
MTRITLATLNALPADAFEAVIAPLFENAPWVTAGLAAMRPFASLTALHAVAIGRLYAADDAGKHSFLRGHPMLSPAALLRGITADSMAEQRSAGIDGLNAGDAAKLDAANTAYLARFSFPFILAVRDVSVATILTAMQRRSTASPAAELLEALREVEVISWLRLLDRVLPASTGGISTHVLDTVRTGPGAGLEGELWHIPSGAGSSRVAHFVTDKSGRAATMLGDGALMAGIYELRLEVAAYLAGMGVSTLDRSLFPSVSVRFAVMNPEEHFHVLVLLSNGAYTAYRGR